MITDEQERRKAGRPRSIESHQAVLDTTLSLLSTQGFEAPRSVHWPEQVAEPALNGVAVHHES